jgi:hypothetical protein
MRDNSNPDWRRCIGIIPAAPDEKEALSRKRERVVAAVIHFLRAQDSRKELLHVIEIAHDERDVAQAEDHSPTLRPAHNRLKRSVISTRGAGRGACPK